MATLPSLQTNGSSNLPPAGSDSQVEVHAILTTILLNEEEYYYEWVIDGKTTQKYSAGEVYTLRMGY